MTARVLLRRSQLLAAGRLAGLYAIGVAVLLLAFLAVVGSYDLAGDVLSLLGLAVGCLGAAFLVLAVARRAGFMTLWVLLLGLWAWQTFGFQPHGPRPGATCLLWSVLALPLGIMTYAGFPDARDRGWMASAGFGAWIGLALAGGEFEGRVADFIHQEAALSQMLGQAVWGAWYALPIILTLAGLWRVRRRASAPVAAA